MSRFVNLFEYLAHSSREHPDRIAVVEPSGRGITYRDLYSVARSVGGYLVANGVHPGDRVGIVAAKSIDVVSSIFGIMAAGAAYVPADCYAPASRNRSLLADCSVKAVFLDSRCEQIVDGWPTADPPHIIRYSGDDDGLQPPGTRWADVAAHQRLESTRLADSDGLAYILYTSGSTGAPKGVAITHANASSFVEWCSETFKPTSDDRFSSHAPFHFDLSILDLYLSIKHGATLYLISEGLAKSPEGLAEFVQSKRLTVWYSTPSILSLLAQFGKLEGRDCTALRLVLFAGEVFPVKHLREIVRLWPQASFYNLYGPTETNVCTFARIPEAIPTARSQPYPIGYACSHCRGIVLESAGGREVPSGQEGLLHIAGPSVFHGYWNAPDAGHFFKHDGQRFYNTGDVVRESENEGYIYVGRRDRMVKRRGYRIELAEIERALYQHEKVREAAVISIPDAASGVRIHAYVSSFSGDTPTIIDMKSYCGRALPSYMNPDVFVVLDELPHTSTDKIDYQGLARAATRGSS